MDGDHALGQVAVPNVFKPGLFYHFGKIILLRKTADRFHQILVRIAVAGDHFTYLGYNIKGISIRKFLLKFTIIKNIN